MVAGNQLAIYAHMHTRTHTPTHTRTHTCAHTHTHTQSIGIKWGHLQIMSILLHQGTLRYILTNQIVFLLQNCYRHDTTQLKENQTEICGSVVVDLKIVGHDEL